MSFIALILNMADVVRDFVGIITHHVLWFPQLKNFQKKKNAAANGKDGRLTFEGAHNFKEVIRPSSLNGSVADAISVGHPESLTESTNASIIDGSSRRSSFTLVSEVVGTNGMKEHSPEQRLSSKNDHSELQNSVDELVSRPVTWKISFSPSVHV